MDPLTRWEAAAIRGRGRRPRPGTGEPTIDLRRPPPPAADPGPDTLLVPLDAWNRMLSQLGNLHEAGRDLADARERAARAETEADFLRERVADLRDQLATARAEPETPADEAPAAPEQPAPTLGTRSRRAVRAAYEGWRAGRRS